MTTPLRLADTTSALAMTGVWPAKPDHIHPILSKLSLRYRELPALERLIAQVTRCQTDEGFRNSADAAAFRGWAGQLAELTTLLNSTRAERHSELALAEQITEFQRKFLKQATGECLEALYAQLPQGLQGVTELGYDSLNNPVLRIFEKVLYHDSNYDSSAQNMRLYAKPNDGEYLPVRLPNSKAEINLRIPHDSPQLDRLFSLDLKPRPRKEVLDLLGLTSYQDPRLPLLFTEQSLPPLEPWTGSAVRVRYLGHACALVEWNGKSVLIDPLIPVDAAIPGEARYSFTDLPAHIDYVVITHSHYDHLDISTLLRLRHRIGCLVLPRASGLLWDYSLKLLAQRIGFKQVIELDAFESLNVGADLEIAAVPFLGEHGDLMLGKSCWLVRAGKEKILFAADCKNLDDQVFANVHRIFGDIQTVFMGTCCLGSPIRYFYSPMLAWLEDSKTDEGLNAKMKLRITDGSDSAGAWSLLSVLKATRVYVYALGFEPWLTGLLGAPHELFRSEGNKLTELGMKAGFKDAKVLTQVEEFLLTQGS